VKKILFSVAISFVIVFFMLYLSYYENSSPDPWRHDIKKFDILENQFYDQHDELNSVFLIGSSYVGVLNTTKINQKIHEASEHTVYNLSRIGDTPERRIRLVDRLIDEEPKLVLYGINYREFESDDSQITLLNQLLISTNPILYSELKNINPKFITMTLINNIVRNNISTSNFTVNYEFTPAIYFPDKSKDISSNDELYDLIPFDGGNLKIIPSYNENHQAFFLDIILEKFDNAGIKVVLFVTPSTQIYLDSIPFEKKETFYSIIQILSQKFDLQVYDLSQRYSDLQIFYNLNHVAINPKSSIYSNDISSIILEELP